MLFVVSNQYVIKFQLTPYQDALRLQNKITNCIGVNLERKSVKNSPYIDPYRTFCFELFLGIVHCIFH